MEHVLISNLWWLMALLHGTGSGGGGGDRGRVTLYRGLGDVREGTGTCTVDTLKLDVSSLVATRGACFAALGERRHFLHVIYDHSTTTSTTERCKIIITTKMRL